MAFHVIRGEGVPTSHLPFSPATRAGDFVFVSGQASVDDAGKIVHDTFEGEFRRSLENASRILAAAGLTLTHVVQVKSYVDNPADLAEYNRLYREFFREPFPARSTIVNCLGGALKYEIDMIAYAGL
jgi:2-iminobutanoate/2-iminopropanoate deaminase